MENLLIGLHAALQGDVLLAVLIGSIIGIIVGVLPGIGSGVSISILLPLTYGMSPLAGLSLVLGIYCGAFYGGSVTSILIRTPGEASSIMTMFDGYPMTLRGEARRALSVAFMSAFIGGIVGALVLTFAAPPVAQIASRFGSAEYAAAGFLALVCVAGAYRNRMAAAAMMVSLGVFVSLIGIDPGSAAQRYTFGLTELQSGLPLVPLVIGVFGITQALNLIGGAMQSVAEVKTERGGLRLNSLWEPFRYRLTLFKSLIIGLFIGVLPAVGAALASTLSYFEARRSSSAPDSFGKGNPEGIVAAESANTANGGGAMVTVMTLGIPGDAVTAIIMSVFVIHGVYPGPALFIEKPDLVYGVFMVMLLLNFVIFAVLAGSVRFLAGLAYANQRILGIGILAMSFIGAYSLENSFYGVWLALGAGVFGWFATRAGLPMVPLVLGMVLADLVEARLRQALMRSDGSFSIFAERPIAAAFVLAALVAIVWPLISNYRTKRQAERRAMSASGGLK